MVAHETIPEEKREAVARGLHEAFGATDLEDIARVTGGQTSSLVFRIVVGGSAYLMKIIRRKEDTTRHYTSMRAAAEAGLAPRVWYTNVGDSVSITDFVNAEPFPVSRARVLMPAVLRKLHALPPFSRAPFNTTCTFLLGKETAVFVDRFRAASVLPEPDYEEFFARHAELVAAYPHDDAEMVASHNDLFKPDNILFDGQRVSLVDWEAAFLNDRYADLAVVANQSVTNDEEEAAYLQAYFGAPPNAYQRARFHLMQQLSHLFYTMAFLTLGSAGQPVDWSDAVPEFTDLQRRIWAHEADLADSAVKIAYGKAHWQRLLENVRKPRYTEALRIVSDRYPAK